MKLFYTPFIGLVHKVQVVAIETGVYDDLDRNPIIPYEQREELVAVNPLSKVPTLVLDDGTPLFGGPVIYEYLDSLKTGPKMYRPAGTPERFVDLRRLSMGEWMFDIANIRNFEQNRPDEHIVTKNVERMENQIRRSMDWAEGECETYTGFTIGQICIACALLYHNWQKSRGRDLVDWRDGRPRLAAWYDRFTDRASFVPRDEEVEEAA